MTLGPLQGKPGCRAVGDSARLNLAPASLVLSLGAALCLVPFLSGASAVPGHESILQMQLWQPSVPWRWGVLQVVTEGSVS